MSADTLRRCGITDISALKNSVLLEELILTNDSIKDISPLSGLTMLKTLNIEGNYEVSYDDCVKLGEALSSCEIAYSVEKGTSVKNNTADNADKKSKDNTKSDK